MKGNKTSPSPAFRVNLNILSKPVPFLLELFLLILQLSQRAAGGRFISCERFKSLVFVDSEHACSYFSEPDISEWLTDGKNREGRTIHGTPADSLRSRTNCGSTAFVGPLLI